MEEQSIKVLLVEDDISYAQLIQVTLTRAKDALFDVEWKDCLAGALDRLHAGGVEVVLLDLNLPDSGGIETFFRVSVQAPDVPVILLTGTDDESLALRAVQMGAQDYLVKGEVSGKHLVRSILYAIQRYRIRKEQIGNPRPNEDYFRYAIERNADGIIVMDKDGTVLYVNPAAEVLFGRSEEELIGEVVGFPFVTGERTQINILHKSGESIVVEMRVVNIKWEGKTAYLASLRDITDYKKAEETLRNLSLNDDLTNLYNRRGFLSLVERYIKSIQGTENRFLIAFLDLDGLKQINDTFGHREGSQALIEVAEILRGTFRDSDIIARFGGDEFVVLVKDTSEESAEVIIDRLQKSVEEHNAKHNRPYRLSISLGIACYDPHNPRSIDELLSCADELMYSNKQSKKDRKSPESSSAALASRQ